MTTMSPADWIAIMLLALSIFAKISVDLMAERQAASAARTLASLPAGVDTKGVEQALVANARDAVVAEMGDLSMPRAKVNVAQVTNLVQGELDKLVVAPVAVLPVPVAGAAVLPAG
jgi:hypothetical protein